MIQAALKGPPYIRRAGLSGPRSLPKARKSFQAFDDKWDSIEDLVKERSADAYVAIEKGMIEIEEALMPEKPDVAKSTALVNEVMRQYNAVLAEIAKEARAGNR